jgi:streptogramin lyase
MKYRFALLGTALLALAGAASSQTVTTVPEGVLFPTDGAARVNGVRVQVQPDGSVWFLEATADSIAFLKDGVIKRWQIRTTAQLGANPVDFQIDGDIVWFIESGQSQINGASCAYAKLDTSTGDLTEWVIPGTIPAAFYRAPNGLVWLPQSGAVMQSFNPETLEVRNYRSAATYAYADLTVAPDGSFWLADFGDNRIVHWVPGAATETSWTFYPLTGGRLNPAQIELDANGKLWIAQRSGNRVDHFDPETNLLKSYTGVTNPIHFDIFQDRLYITSIATKSTVTVLDPNIATPAGTLTLTPLTLDVGSSPSQRAVTIRNTRIIPTEFVSVAKPIAATDFAVTNPSATQGMLTTTFSSVNTYGIAVIGGRVWAGTDGNLAALNLQAIGIATDQAVPVASSLAGPADSKIQVDITLANLGTAAISGQSFYLFSPGSFAPKTTFTLAPGATTLFADNFGNVSAHFVNGPVRIGSTSGNAAELFANVRTSRVVPGGGSFGYLLPATSVTTALTTGSTTTLFTGASDSEISILSLSSLVDARATLSLLAPDGTTRGSGDFEVAKNASLMFNPAASAFGATPEPGDVIQVAVTTGTLEAAVLVFDSGTIDVAPSLPAAAGTEGIFPYVAAIPGTDQSIVSDLFLSNPAADASAAVSIAFSAIGATGAPQTATITLPPLGSQSITDVLPTLYGVQAGAGALVVSSDIPVAAAIRLATSTTAGDYGTYADAISGAAGTPGGHSAFGIGLPQTATRTGYLLLYNDGAAGTITVTGFRSDGTEAGHLPLALGAQAAGYVGGVFAALGVSNQAAGRIRVDVPEGMNVFGWTAALDTLTGDIDISPLQ